MKIQLTFKIFIFLNSRAFNFHVFHNHRILVITVHLENTISFFEMSYPFANRQLQVWLFNTLSGGTSA